MNVYVWIKHKEHPQPDSQGSQKGDVSYIYPMIPLQGKLVHDTFFPVVVDMTIPCGEDFTVTEDNVVMYNCNRCEHDHETCDVIKYSRAEWSDGDLFDPPVLLKKRRYSIDIDSILSGTDSVALVENTDNTEAEKAEIISRAVKYPQPKTILIDKVE